MYDIVPHGGKRTRWNLADFNIKRMVLSPLQWKACRLPVQLTWSAVKFTDRNLHKIPQTCGVYTFLVQPGIANHPHCSYLLYVGKTEDQDFRLRYRQYLREKEVGDESTWPHMNDMLWKWDGFLWFCYASVWSNLIDKVEKALLTAYLPPTNKRFPAKVNAKLSRLFGT